MHPHLRTHLRLRRCCCCCSPLLPGMCGVQAQAQAVAWAPETGLPHLLQLWMSMTLHCHPLHLLLLRSVQVTAVVAVLVASTPWQRC